MPCGVGGCPISYMCHSMALVYYVESLRHTLQDIRALCMPNMRHIAYAPYMSP